jgi:hypothetical protein
MANWFEDFTKTIADDKIGRRTAMRRIAGSLASAALASAVPGLALAKKKACPVGGNCTIGFKNCQGNSNTNCYCFTDSTGKGKCGCNMSCSGIFTCNRDSDCGKGSICIILNGCTGCGGTSGTCVFKCSGAHKNCQIGSGQGPTAAQVH